MGQEGMPQLMAGTIEALIADERMQHVESLLG
jgi:hypothetical protein